MIKEDVYNIVTQAFCPTDTTSWASKAHFDAIGICLWIKNANPRTVELSLSMGITPVWSTLKMGQNCTFNVPCGKAELESSASATAITPSCAPSTFLPAAVGHQIAVLRSVGCYHSASSTTTRFSPNLWILMAGISLRARCARSSGLRGIVKKKKEGFPSLHFGKKRYKPPSTQGGFFS